MPVFIANIYELCFIKFGDIFCFLDSLFRLEGPTAHRDFGKGVHWRKPDIYCPHSIM